MSLVAKFMTNPYLYYHRLRSHDPVHWNGDSWILTRYADVVQALRDPRLSSARFSVHDGQAADIPPATCPLNHHLSRWMLYSDPPAHPRLRALVNQAFTARVVEQLRPHIQTVVDRLLDAVQDQGHMDVIRDLAYPLPAIVIAELLGVAPEDRVHFKQWSADIALYLGNEHDATYAAQAHQSLGHLTDYLHGLIAARRRTPQPDVMSGLIAAEMQANRLNAEELVACCTLLLIAGHETTTNLIGNGLLALLQHPEQLQQLKQDPALITPAVEELLRYDSPVHLAWRRAKDDLEIGGKQISAGQLVLLNLAAANRDPNQFPQPDQLDMTRTQNRHVAFGYGPHFCLGAPLARVEGQIAINTIVRRVPTLELEPVLLTWHANLAFRGLTALPVRFA